MAEREPGQPESVEGSGAFERAAGATSFLQRAVIRRRVRFLRRRRELALHDLGGFLFESHRLGLPREDLLAGKLTALDALDDELALLQRSLSMHEELAVLREPGIAACAHCATIRDSAANFCPNCGRPAASPPEDEPQIASAVAPAPAALTADTAVQPPAEVTAEAAAAQPPAGPSDDTAVRAPTASDPSATAEAVATPAPAPPAGAPSPATADGPS